MTLRQAAHKREKERIKQRLRDEPDSAWSIAYRAKRKEQQRRWYEKNPDAKKRHGKAYYTANREKLVAKAAELKRKKRRAIGMPLKRTVTKEETAERLRKWNADNRERNNAKRRERRAADMSFRLACNLRKRLSFLVRKASTSKTAQTLVLLGCSLPSFMRYLEGKFSEGMSFENYGQWHIDHIIPCASFDLTNPEHQKRCFHYSNLQPLWAKENRIKSCYLQGGRLKTRIRFTV